MPVPKCLESDSKCISEAIAKLIREGYPRDQAVAIVLSNAVKTKAK
jgi:hypothetical protein